MANRKLTIEEAEMTGAKYRNPGRYKNNVPKSESPFGLAPKYFAADEKKCWKEIVEASPAGVLTGADRWAVETLCLLMAKMRRREEMRGADYSTLMGGLAKLAMTPVDRQKLNMPKEEDAEDEFSDFDVN